MTSSSKGSVAGYGNYLLQEEKTEITLIETKSCTTDFVRDFAITKNLNGKTDGVQFHEIVQSFSPGEVTPKQAHEIGQQMLKDKKFENFQVVLVTHKDREHIHNHIIINSVSYVDGKKYQQNKHDLKAFKEHSNALCKERGLSYIDLSKKAERYINQKENKIFKSGEISKKEELRDFIKEAREVSTNLEDLKDYLKIKHGVETKIQNKNIKFKHPDLKNFVNGKRLGAEFEKGALKDGICGQHKEKERTIIEPRRAEKERTIDYTTRDGNKSNVGHTVSEDENIRSGIDESREHTIKTDVGQLHEQLQQIRGIDKKFNPEEQRRIREREAKITADIERSKSSIKQEPRDIEKQQRHTIRKDREYSRGHSR